MIGGLRTLFFSACFISGILAEVDKPSAPPFSEVADLMKPSAPPLSELESHGAPVTKRSQILKERQDKLNTVLSAQKKDLIVNEAAQQRIDTRAQARVTQSKAQTVVDATTNINDFLTRLPLAIRQQHPTAAIGVLNQIIQGLSVGVRALARRQELLQAIEGTDEQILEAATQSYEKINKLAAILENLIGAKTVKMAYEENKSSDMSAPKKLLNLFTPMHYFNTFQKITDDLYITENKAIRWEKIKATQKELQEEQERFDDYIALMQIKVLERLIMGLHNVQNKHAVIPKLQEYLTTTNKAIDLTQAKIDSLMKQQPDKGLLNTLKKTVGKNSTTQRNQELANLTTELQKYQARKAELKDQIKQLTLSSNTSDDINNQRESLKKQIAEINLKRTKKLKPEDLAQVLSGLQDQVNQLEKTVQSLSSGKR